MWVLTQFLFFSLPWVLFYRKHTILCWPGTLICQNLNRNWPQMSKCKWSNKLKHTFLFSQDPDWEFNKSLPSQVPRQPRWPVARSYWHTIMFQSHKAHGDTWRAAGRQPGVTCHVSLRRFQSCQCPSLLTRRQEAQVPSRCSPVTPTFLFMTRLCPTLHQDDGN